MLSLRYCNSYFKKGLYKKELMDLILSNENNKNLTKENIINLNKKEKEPEDKKMIKKKTYLLFN